MYSLPGRDGELDTIANQVVEYLLQSVFILVKWRRIGIYLIKEHLRLFISQRTKDGEDHIGKRSQINGPAIEGDILVFKP